MWIGSSTPWSISEHCLARYYSVILGLVCESFELVFGQGHTISGLNEGGYPCPTLPFGLLFAYELDEVRESAARFLLKVGVQGFSEDFGWGSAFVAG
jgi:hypothetical protein